MTQTSFLCIHNLPSPGRVDRPECLVACQVCQPEPRAMWCAAHGWRTCRECHFNVREPGARRWVLSVGDAGARRFVLQRFNRAGQWRDDARVQVQGVGGMEKPRLIEEEEFPPERAVYRCTKGHAWEDFGLTAPSEANAVHIEDHYHCLRCLAELLGTVERVA